MPLNQVLECGYLTPGTLSHSQNPKSLLTTCVFLPVLLLRVSLIEKTGIPKKRQVLLPVSLLPSSQDKWSQWLPCFEIFFFSERRLVKSESCVPSRFTCWNLTSQVMVMESGGLQGQSPHRWDPCAHRRGCRDPVCTSTIEGHKEGVTCKAQHAYPIPPGP